MAGVFCGKGLDDTGRLPDRGSAAGRCFQGAAVTLCVDKRRVKALRTYVTLVFAERVAALRSPIIVVPGGVKVWQLET